MSSMLSSMGSVQDKGELRPAGVASLHANSVESNQYFLVWALFGIRRESTPAGVAS